MSRLATKDHAQREDEESERLVRPPPKVKPSRHDRKRERVRSDRDTDVEGDPDLKTKDKSLNYKIVGRVLSRYGASDRIPVVNKETGDTVQVSPNTLKEQPGKYEPVQEEEAAPETQQSAQLQPKPKKPKGEGKPKKPEGEGKPKKPKKPKPAPESESPEGDAPAKKKEDSESSDKEPEEAEEPETVAQKHGISEPKRRTASPEEYAQANMLLADNLPPKLAAKLIADGLHPDDAVELLSSFKSLQSRTVGNVSEYADKVSKIYVSDPGQVPPPVVWKGKDGQKVAFEDLDPETKAVAYRQHQMQTLALGAVARQQITEKLSFPTVKGPTIPPSVAGFLADVLLTGNKLSEDSVQKSAQAVFESTAGTGPAVSIPPGTVKQLMASLKGNPAATEVAQSYLAANDYKQAKDLLKNGEVSEKDSPAKIASAIQEVTSFFDEKAKIYGMDQHRGKQHFENKVLGKLRSLDPAKYQQVRQAVDKANFKAYEKAQKSYEKALRKWKESHVDSRGEPPQEPLMPVGVSNALPQEQWKEKGRSLWSDLLGRMGKSKSASVAARYLISSYLQTSSMASNSRKTGLYHGINPAENYPVAPYPGWGPAHQRDLGEPDYEILVEGAQSWLKQPVLTQGVEGMLEDQRTRFALDMAIQDSPYNGQIDATTYSMLLARLQGVPEPGLGQTKLAGDRAQLEKDLFKRFPADSKQKAGGKLKVLLTGSAAKALRKDDLSTVVLADLSESELEKLAQVMRVKTASKSRKNLRASSFEPGDSMHPSYELRQLATRVAAINPSLGYDLLAVAGRVAAAERQAAERPEMTTASEPVKLEDKRYSSLRSTILKTAQALDSQGRAAFKPILQALKDLG